MPASGLLQLHKRSCVVEIDCYNLEVYRAALDDAELVRHVAVVSVWLYTLVKHRHAVGVVAALAKSEMLDRRRSDDYIDIAPSHIGLAGDWVSADLSCRNIGVDYHLRLDTHHDAAVNYCQDVQLLAGQPLRIDIVGEDDTGQL